MKRDYLKWHVLKSFIEKNHKQQFFREKEIWWCSLGANLGFEQDGKHEKFERPVLVLRKFNQGMFWCLPLTSRPKHGKYYFSFYIKGKEITVILSQLRVISTKRLIRRIGRMNNANFSNIRRKIRDLI